MSTPTTIQWTDPAARMTAALDAEKARKAAPPAKPDPAHFGWADGKIRNSYTAELMFDRTNDQAGEDAFPEWLDLPGSIEVVIHAFNHEEARDLAHKAGAAVLRGLGIAPIKEDAQGADSATVQCYFQGELKLKTARVLTREDVEEWFGDVPLYFQSHYKQFWSYEGRVGDFVITWCEVDTDHRYSVDVKQPITINDRGICECQIVDTRSNLIVFEKAQSIFR